MSRWAKLSFLVFIIIAAIGGTYAYFLLRNSKPPTAKAIHILPAKPMWVAGARHITELSLKIKSQSLVVDKLRGISSINLLCHQLAQIDSMLFDNEQLQADFEDNTVYIALYKSDWLVAMNVKKLGETDQIKSALTQAFKSNSEGMFYLGQHKTWFELHNGIVMLGSSRGIINEAIDPVTPRLTNDPDYKKMKDNWPEGANTALYIDHSQCEYNELLPGSELKSGYSAGALEILPNQLKIYGAYTPDSLSPLNFLAKQEPAEVETLQEILLPSVQAFTAYGFNTIAIPSSQKYPELSNRWNEINQRAMYNATKEFYENCSGLMVRLRYMGRALFLVQVKDSIQCAEHLKFLADTNKGNFYSLDWLAGAELFPDQRSGYQSYALQNGKLLLFAEDSTMLQQYSLMLNKTPSYNDLFAYLEDNAPKTFNYMVYQSPVKQYAGPDETSQTLKDFKHILLSLVNQQDGFSYRVHIDNTQQVKEGGGRTPLWALRFNETLLPTAVFPFVNHKTGENEIVVQDSSHQLSLINTKGELMWQIKLEGRVHSIYKVDALRNNKFQMLMCTGQTIHLIDRNGKEVEGFPIQLPAKAVSPLSLIDYDNDGEIRIYVACADKKIYNYSLQGKPATGFVPLRTENEVNLPVQFARVGESDYLVALDAEGRIYTFSRKGAGRIGLTQKGPKRCRGFYLDVSNKLSSTQIVFVSEAGDIGKISFTDVKEVIPTGTNWNTLSTCFELIDENKTMDVLGIEGQAVKGFDLNGSLLFSEEFSEAPDAVKYYKDETHKLYLAYNKESGMVWVRDGERQLLTEQADELPLIMDLYRTGKLYLLLIQKNELRCVALDN